MTETKTPRAVSDTCSTCVHRQWADLGLGVRDAFCDVTFVKREVTPRAIRSEPGPVREGKARIVKSARAVNLDGPCLFDPSRYERKKECEQPVTSHSPQPSLWPQYSS